MAKRLFLKAELVYKYLMGDDKMETLIMCKPYDMELTTTDQSLYEALGSIKDKSKISYNKLVKFLENVDVVSFRHTLKQKRKILYEKRVQEIQEYVDKKKGVSDRNGRKENKL